MPCCLLVAVRSERKVRLVLWEDMRHQYEEEHQEECSAPSVHQCLTKLEKEENVEKEKGQEEKEKEKKKHKKFYKKKKKTRDEKKKRKKRYKWNSQN